MGYFMYVCPECKKVFKVQGNDKKVKCSNCANILKDMRIAIEDWEVMDKAQREDFKNRSCMPEEVEEVVIPEPEVFEEPIQPAKPKSPQSSFSGSFFDDFNDNAGSTSVPETSEKPVTTYNNYNTGEERTGHSKLSIIALILGALGCTAIVGMILAIVDLAKSKDDDKKHVCSWICIGVASLWLVGGAVMGLGKGADKVSGRKEIADSSSATESVQEDSTDESDNVAEQDSSNEGSENASTAATDSPAITIDEQVLVDEDGLKITALEYVTDSLWGDGIKLLIENNTTSDIGVGCDALIVNDYMITDLFSSTVAAGKKSNEVMNLLSSELKAAGINNVGKVEIYMHTFDADSYSTIKKFPCFEIKTSEYENMDSTVNDEGKELYNGEGVRIVGKYVDEDSFWGAAVLLYIENNSGKNVIVSCDDMSINGFMMTPYFSATVYDGKKAIEDITLLSSELEQNGITSIDDIELKFHIVDPDTYSTIKETDVISFSAK